MLFNQDCPLDSGVGDIQWSMGKPLAVTLLKITIRFPKNTSAVNSSPGKSRTPWGFSPPMTECPEAQVYAGLVPAIVATISLVLQGLHHVQMRALDYLSQLTILMRKKGERKEKRRKKMLSVLLSLKLFPPSVVTNEAGDRGWKSLFICLCKSSKPYCYA